MKPLPLLACVLTGTLGLSSCRPEPLPPTGVLVDLMTKDPRLYATSFSLAWFDERDHLLDVRVPEQGFLDELQAPAVSVFIGIANDRVGLRRLLVRGFRDEGPVSEAVATVQAGPDVWTEIGVPMEPFGSLADTDGDGLPDPIDNCPRMPDPCAAEPPGVDLVLDAGAPPPDGGGSDLATDADAGEPDARRDVGPDLVIAPTGFADGGRQN